MATNRTFATTTVAKALLVRMEGDSELTGKVSKPETGGHITRIYIKARK